MKAKVKKIIGWLVGLAVAVLLLWFAFRTVDLDSFKEGLKSCNFWYILGVIAIQWLITLLRGNRWRVLLRPLSKDITVREAYDAYALCYLANMAVPRSGEVAKCGIIAATKKASFEGAVGTVVIERSWDILCVFILCIPLLFFGSFHDFLVENVFQPAMSAIGLGTLWQILIFAAVIALIVLLVVKFKEKLKANKASYSILKFFKGIGEGVKASFTMDHKGSFFIYTAVIWAGYLYCNVLTFKAFPVTAGLDWMDALFLLVIGSLGWMIPVPGGFGAYHWIFTLAMESEIYRFSHDTGMLLATVSHEAQSIQMLLCGLISLVGWAFYKRQFKQIDK